MTTTAHIIKAVIEAIMEAMVEAIDKVEDEVDTGTDKSTMQCRTMITTTTSILYKSSLIIFKLTMFF